VKRLGTVSQSLHGCWHFFFRVRPIWTLVTLESEHRKIGSISAPIPMLEKKIKIGKIVGKIILSSIYLCVFDAYGVYNEYVICDCDGA